MQIYYYSSPRTARREKSPVNEKFVFPEYVCYQGSNFHNFLLYLSSELVNRIMRINKAKVVVQVLEPCIRFCQGCRSL